MFNMLTALATGLTALATIALVWATARYMKEQNDRAKKAQRTELFLQLRQHATSPDHIARRRRVIALLMHLEKRELSTCALKFSPDINLYLNDYQWIGRLMKDGMLTEEYVQSTYARNLLILYPKLKPYIKKERRERGHDNLWSGVSDLYKKFKHLDKDLSGDKIDERYKSERERWLRPSTILTTRENSLEEVDVDRLLQNVDVQEGIVLRYYFHGKNGQRYRVDYFNFPGAPRDETRNNLVLPQLADVKLQLAPFIREVWPGYPDVSVASTVAKFDKFARFALAYTSDDKLVAFNVYEVGSVETTVGPAKTIYVSHAGTLPEHQGHGITQAIRNEFYRREKPDIICGSSANQLIYQTNKNIAVAGGMVFYPRRDDTDSSRLCVPEAIEELAIQIVETLEITSAALDPTRLVRIYKHPVAPTPVPHELQDLLQLDEYQHMFYILVSSKLNEALLEARK